VPKKIIQIAVSPAQYVQGVGDAVYALSEDGQIYYGEWVDKKFTWDKDPLPPLSETE